MQLDLKHADFGDRFGHVERIRRISGDRNRERHDRAVIAAIGPVLAGVDLDHPSAVTDSRCVDANWADGWPLEAWRFIVTERARDLARHEPVRYSWRLLVVALGELGERFVELRGDEVDAFIAASVLPNATSFEGSPRAEVAASARRSGRSRLMASSYTRPRAELRRCGAARPLETDTVSHASVIRRRM